MGAYVYAVSTKAVTLSDGRKVYGSNYSYKPYMPWGDGEKKNAQMAFRSGHIARVAAFDRAVKAGKINLPILVTIGPPGEPRQAVYQLNCGEFSDDWLDSSVEKKVGYLGKYGEGWQIYSDVEGL